MKSDKKSVRLYNVLFPFWMLIRLPQLWVFIIPGNFIIDSIVLLAGMAALKISDKKQWYKKYILKIFSFGMLSDIIAAGFIIGLMFLGVGRMGDELYLTLPGLLIAAALIFVFNYYITFKNVEKPLRFRMALIFAVVTAPYTFIIPSGWIYG